MRLIDDNEPINNMDTIQRLKKGRWGLYAALLLTVGGALSACRDKAVNNLSPADQAVYITNYDKTTDFSQYKTFSLPDSVVIQSNDGYGTAASDVSTQLVNSVAQALTARGFVRVAQGQPADLGVAIIRVDNSYTGVASNPYSYYNSYYGFGGLGGFGYYPYYPSYYTYQVTDQYWKIDLLDLKNRPTTTGTSTNPQSLTVLYDASVRGSDITDVASASTAVTALFNQSPYLQAAK